MLRNLWKDWELRVLVLLSLVLQIVLIIFGNRRKYSSRTWIRIFLWCAYLMADSIATVALGVISNNLGDAIEGIDKDGSLDPHIEITAFWAQFLLLHLGGPDTITAYSMEDNELWLRHFLGLGVQTGVALYIYLMAWTGSKLSFLSILIFCAGIIKYGERTWVLRSASNEQFRESMLTPSDPSPYLKVMRECTIKEIEGFDVIAKEKIEAQVVNHPSAENISIPDETELVVAYDLFQSFKRLFVDLILGSGDLHKSQYVFMGISYDKAFKLIEIELGFMYDVLYTKATLIHSRLGWGLRLMSFSSTCIVLALFLIIDKHKYLTIDLVLTFLLLVVAVLLEVYAVPLLLSSDWTDLWLSKHTNTSIRQAITCLQLSRHPRWSNSLSQLNLFSFSLKDKHTVLYGIQKLLHIDKVLEKHRYTTRQNVPEHLRELIFKRLKEASNDAIDLRTMRSCPGRLILEKYHCVGLDWSIKVEFEQSIIIWHIATDLCYHSDRTEILEGIISKKNLSKWLSQYMLYLLVMCPFMLPMGIVGMISFRDTCTEVKNLFEVHEPISDNTRSYSNKCWNRCAEILLSFNTKVPPTTVEEYRSESVLFYACRLASQLQAISDKEMKWEMVSAVWVEMLVYAASQCRVNYHAQQLRRGGELLTHVWLLMAHFGLTEQYEISRGHARAELVVI